MSSLEEDMPDKANTGIAGLLEESRVNIKRVHPGNLRLLCEQGAIVVDVRPKEQRFARDGGEIPDSIAICRSVLEWRLDPLCESKLEIVDNSWY